MTDSGGSFHTRLTRSRERWHDVSRLADLALELPPAERAAFVRRECADDRELFDQVTAFLSACERIEAERLFLDQPARLDAEQMIAEVEAHEQAERDSVVRLAEEALADRFTIHREIGQGGMATVFLARDHASGQDVALKVVTGDLVRQVGAKRFLREIHITRSLRHPNIVSLLDAGAADGLLYYTMPFIHGESLRERLAEEGQLATSEVLRIGRDVAAALDAAHAAGVVHRDIKPANILLDGERALVADFGVACALEEAGSERLTATGVRVGTAAYMSPEQVLGNLKDQRADVYSLGCVLYEMLAGEPPYPGASKQSILAKHLYAPIPDVRLLREMASEATQQVLSRALAKQAVDRFASAGKLMRALEGALSAERTTPWAPPPAPRAAVFVPAHRRARLQRGVLITALAAFAMGAVWFVGGEPEAAAADTTRILLLPVEGDTQGIVNDALFYQAFARWRDVSVVHRLELLDSLRRRPPVRPGRDEGKLASTLRAGRFVRRQMTSERGGHRIDAALYDAGTSRVLYRASETIGANADTAAAVYARLVDSLLLRGASLPPVAGIAVTRTLAAAHHMDRGLRALDRWDLARADSAFVAAVEQDRKDASANLLLAQVRAWEGLPSVEWVTAAERAHLGRTSLLPRDQRAARALLLLGTGDYAGACRAYDEMRRGNDADFAVWYGLWQCRWMDRLVVRDAGSPSGWRFRSDYDSALTALSTAFSILPVALQGFEPGAFERLRQVLLLSVEQLPGRSADSAAFHAGAGLIGGRLVLVPYPWKVMYEGGWPAVPPGFGEAIVRQKRRFRDIASRWSAAFPASSGAKHAVALSLELMGDVAAVDTLRLARRLANDVAAQRQLALSQVFVLVKFGVPDRPDLLRAAASLADSLLDEWQDRTPDDAVRLASLAALRGRCGVADSLARRAGAANQDPMLPSQLSGEVEGLLARIALGCRVEPGRLGVAARAIANEYQGLNESERRRLSEALLFRPLLLSDVLDSALLDGVGRSSGSAALRASRALTRGERAVVRSELEGVRRRRVPGSPATPDVSVPTARLWVAIGDTAAAIATLDTALLTLRGYDPQKLPTDHAVVASLLRAMVLRADLAARMNDVVAARRWSLPLAILWSDAHPDLQPVVRRMSGLAAR